MLFVKLVVVGLLTGFILIALLLVDGLISSRQGYRDQARTSIWSSYATDQRLIGPVLVQPYRQTLEEKTTEKGVVRTTSRTVDGSYVVFPRALSVTGTMVPAERRHGLYRVPVYEFQGHLDGGFDVPDLSLTGEVKYGVPYLLLTLSDVRGIVGTPVVRVDGTSLTVLHGASLTAAERANGVPVNDPGWGPDLRVPLPLPNAGKPTQLRFALDLTLAGTEKLQVAPVADANRFEMRSSWRAPLFGGAFLPRTRELSPDGFHAVWEISSLAAGTQQELSNNPKGDLEAASVELIDPIDPYKLSDRAVKYGILFVLLTFGGFFLFEIVKQLPIHPVQYLLVGFGLAVFFLLLVSLSEHIPFALAYLLASVACIGLLTFYLTAILRSAKFGLAFGVLLTLLYAAIYGLLISEDNALLLGSLLLFGLLAGIMALTRNVDWYRGSAQLMSLKAEQSQAVPPPPRVVDRPPDGGSSVEADRPSRE